MVNRLDGEQGCLDSTAGQVHTVSVTELLVTLYKHKWVVGLVCLIAMGVAGVLSVLAPKMYAATASVILPLDFLQKDTSLSSKLGVGGKSLLTDIIRGGGIADMFVGVLKSRAVADALVDRFDLIKAYENVESRTDARTALAGNTAVDVSKEGIIRVTVQDRDPNRAAALANAYVEELDKQNKRLSAGQAAGKRVFLEARLKEIERDLSRVEDLKSREASIKEMLFELLAREVEAAKIEEAKSMPTIQVLDPAIVPERRLARGTIRKTLLAGFAAFAITAFGIVARQGLRRAQACV